MEADGPRADRIAHELASTGVPFLVRSWYPVHIAVCLAALALLLLIQAASVHSVPLGVLGVMATLAAIWSAALVRANRSVPLLTFSNEGIRTTPYGFIPWDAISGVYLGPYGPRAGGNTLMLRVPTLPERRAGFSRGARLLQPLRPGILRERVRIPLMLASERPAVVYRLCEQMWRKRTGSQAGWLPNDPELTRYFDRIEEERRRLDAARTPEQAAAQLQRFATAADEAFRYTVRKTGPQWLQWLFAALAILVVALFIVVALLRVRG